MPAFYMDWFMTGISQGWFDVTHPYTRQVRRVAASPDHVHTIVFWSKNYGPFLHRDAHRMLNGMGYRIYYHFTINSVSPLLEPGVPSLGERLSQLARLTAEAGPVSIAWRFDPITFFRTPDGETRNNLSDFTKIAETAADLGLSGCITSFADLYRKVDRRVAYLKRSGRAVPEFLDIDIKKKTAVISRMADFLAERDMTLSLCCEKELCSRVKEHAAVTESRCISGPLFAGLFGGEAETARDYGQRTKQGCNCTRSVDIGSYDRHPCFHNCVFCYANPAIDRDIGNRNSL